MTEVEIINGLLSALPACRNKIQRRLEKQSCSQPATYYTDTGEIGYHLYYCDVCKEKLPENLGVNGLGEDISAREMKVAEVIREAQKFLAR